MTAYRLRIKLEDAQEPFWLDVEIGAERTLADLGATINDALGLDDGSLWFFGTDRDYWSSPVKYQNSHEFESLPSGGPMWWNEDVFNAADTTIGMLGLDAWDRICYLVDYVNEWRFYAIVKSTLERAPDDAPPEVIEQKGGPVSDIVPDRRRRDG